MSSIQETAYPRLKSLISPRDLLTIYTPTVQEIALAEQVTRSQGSRLCFLILLKTFQRLGYFVSLQEVPEAICEHIAQSAQTPVAPSDLEGYDRSGTRKRHLQVIRQTLHVQPYGKEARHQMLLAMQEAAQTREAIADIINAALEELVRQKYELPAFDTLVRGARHARAGVYRQFYQQWTPR